MVAFNLDHMLGLIETKLEKQRTVDDSAFSSKHRILNLSW